MFFDLGNRDAVFWAEEFMRFSKNQIVGAVILLVVILTIAYVRKYLAVG